MPLNHKLYQEIFKMSSNMALLVVLYLVMLTNSFSGSTSSSNGLDKKECAGEGNNPLQPGVYKDSCPEAEPIIFSWVDKAVSEDSRMAASLLRLHFHDCFVNGCDASVLLDDTPNMKGEKTAAPNVNSLRGFELIDSIKSDLESICPQTVSCADILAIVARDSVVLSGGPGWEVETGRKDSIIASITAANNSIPGPNSDVNTLVNMFKNVGLTLDDMVALSGAHTMGKARCSTFTARLKGNPDSVSPETNQNFLQPLQQLCSGSSSNAKLAQLDLVTPSTFDNQYYVNLISGEGLLPSDQVLVSGNEQTREIVQNYASNMELFFKDFATSMVRMGSLRINAKDNGEIRSNCRNIN